MKIAFINVTPNGCTGRIMTQTAESLAKKGHSCVIFYGRGKAEESQYVKKIKIESNFSVYWHVVKARLFGKNGHGSVLPTKDLIDQLEDFDPDIIQLHNIHGYYINIFMLFDYLRTSRANVIWTLHDCWSFTGGCAYFTSHGCNKWRRQCRHCGLRNEYPKSFVETTKREYKNKKECFTGLKNLTLVTPCDWLKDLVGKSFLKEYKCIKIENGIDQEKFNIIKSDAYESFAMTLPKKYILGVASVWDNRKRPDVFIKIADKLAKLGISSVMIGKVKKYDMKKYPNIIYFERTEDTELLAELYRNAMCVVSPSVDDTFPTIGLEAMACGTPVVYSDVCGCPEQILPEPVTGEVAIPDDVDDFVKKICKIRLNQEKYKENCIEKAGYYTEKRMCEDYRKLYVSTGINEPSNVKRKSLTGKIVKSVFSFIAQIVISISVITLAVTLISTFCIRNNEVVGNSMLPNYTDGESVKSSGLSYIFSEPEIGDVIIIDADLDSKCTFFTKLRDGFSENLIGRILKMENDNTYYLKRVVGVPGDKIEFIKGQFYRNGELVEEDYLYEDDIYTYPYKYSYVVEEGYVFVMGDNRNVSVDSREIGPVPISHIVGKVIEN